MKKPFFYLMFFLSVFQLNAQQTGFYAGLFAGFQSSWILNSDDQDAGGLLDYDNTYNSSFGLDIGYKFNLNSGLQTGIRQSLQGQNYSTQNNPHANYKTELSYLKIPLVFCYQLKPEKKLSFIFQAGFQLSLLNEVKSSRNNVFEYYQSAFVDVKKYYASSVIDLVLACGIQYQIKQFNIQLLIRPDYSLSDIEVTEFKPGLRGPSSNLTLQIPQFGIQYFFK